MLMIIATERVILFWELFELLISQFYAWFEFSIYNHLQTLGNLQKKIQPLNFPRDWKQVSWTEWSAWFSSTWFSSINRQILMKIKPQPVKFSAHISEPLGCLFYASFREGEPLIQLNSIWSGNLFEPFDRNCVFMGTKFLLKFRLRHTRKCFYKS